MTSNATQGILLARERLKTATPLARDCGRLCAAACCQADETGAGGMLLYPGEAALYAQPPVWARVSTATIPGMESSAVMLTCDGDCDRAERPFACRLFPLVPLTDGEGYRLSLDARAWPVCPLMPQGMKALSPAFISAADSAIAILWQDADHRQFLRAQSELALQFTRL